MAAVDECGVSEGLGRPTEVLSQDLINMTQLSALSNLGNALMPGRGLTREGPFLGDPWQIKSPALRQLGAAARLGPKGELPGGLRPCQHGIVITANKAPPLAKIQIARIKIKRKKRPKETEESDKDNGKYIVLPDIRQKSGESSKSRVSKAEKQNNADKLKKSAEKKKKGNGSQETNEIMMKAKLMKPKKGKEKPTKSAKSDDAKSDGSKSDSKKSRKKGSQIKKTARPIKSAGPKVKNSGMCWAITFDDNEDDNQDSTDNKESSETKSEETQSSTSEAQKMPDELEKTAEKIPNLKEETEKKSRRVSSSSGLKKNAIAAESKEKYMQERKPASAGISKKSSKIDLKVGQKKTKNEIADKLNSSDKSDKTKQTKAKKPVRPSSAKLGESKSLQRRGSQPRNMITRELDFDLPQKGKPVSIRPSSAGFDRRKSFDIDSFKPKKGHSEEQMGLKKEPNKLASDSSHQSSATKSSPLQNESPSAPNYKIKTKNETTLANEVTKDNTENIDDESEEEMDEGVETIPEVLQDFLHGKIHHLHDPPKTSVRIFLSSTFSDMKVERNALSTRSYPELTELCRQHNLDFHTVDMRWGVTDEAGNDHKTSILCIQEILLCQRLSVGPNYVLFVGDRYGSRPLPSEIDKNEFNILNAIIKEKNLDKADLLKSWFLLDENALPPIYSLQPISSIILDYGNVEDKEKGKAASKKWDEVNDQLTSLLRDAATEACSLGQLSEESKHIYFQSVTEEEINYGLFKSSGPNQQTLVYTREMQNLRDHLDDDLAWKWIDVLEKDGKNTLDGSALEQLENLKKSKIPRALSVKNRSEFETTWHGNGLEPEKYEDNQKYLDKFVERFTEDMKRLIVDAANDLKKSMEPMMHMKCPDMVKELYQHSKLCKTYCDDFIGQESLLQEAKSYVLETANYRTPLIISGASGHGVSAVMAKISDLFPKWLNVNQYVSVTRFCGLTPYSSDIEQLLKFTCYQITTCYGEPLPDIGEDVNLQQVAILFRNLIKTLEENGKLKIKPLFLVFDSLQNIESAKKNSALQWMLPMLYENIYMVVSCPLDHQYVQELEKTSQRQRGIPQKIITVNGIEGDSQMIVKHLLKKKNRCVTDEQMSLLKHTFKNNSSALLMSVTLDEAAEWKSYQTNYDELHLEEALDKAINVLFTQLETGYGQTLVSYALSYITATKSGIMETELEDILSCNDAVMDSVYQYHNPPVPGIVRIPSLLWSRVRNVLGKYLREVVFQGKTVLSWFHPHFNSAAETRYFHCHGEQYDDYYTSIHRDFVELYEAETSIKRTIVLHNRKLTVVDADRQTKPQPLCSDNTRKLLWLPYHLQMANSDIETLKKNIFCNFEFLQTKLDGVGYKGLLGDFLSCHDPDEETCLVMDMILQGGTSFVQFKSHSALAVEIIGRMPNLGKRFPGIQILVDDAKKYLRGLSEPYLAPSYPCLSPPGEMLKKSASGVKGILSYDYPSGRCVGLLKTGKIEIWDFLRGDSIQALTNSVDDIWQLHGSSLVSCNGTTVTIFNVQSGIPICSFKPFPSSPKADPHGQVVASFCIDDRERMFCAGKYEPSIFAVDLVNKSLLYELNGRDTSLEERVINENPDAVITDLVTRKQHTIPGHLSDITDVQITRDGVSLISSDNCTLCFWDASEFTLKSTHYVTSCDNINLSEDGAMLVATSEQDILLFNVSEGSLLKCITVEFKEGEDDTRLTCPSISWDNKYVVCATGTACINIYNIDDGRIIQTLARNSRLYPSTLVLDKVNQFLLGDGAGGFLKVWHIPTGDLVLDLKSSATTVDHIFYTPNCVLATNCSSEESLKIYSLTDTLMEKRKQFQNCITDETIKMYETKQVALWEKKSMQSLAKIDRTEKPYTSGIDLIKCIDTSLSEEAQTPDTPEVLQPTYDMSTPCAATTSDGSRIVTIDRDGVLQVWNCRTAQMSKNIQTEGCQNIKVAHKDKIIVGLMKKRASSVLTLKLWDIDSLELIRIKELPGDEDLPVQTMVISSTSSFLYGAYITMTGVLSFYVLDLAKQVLRYVVYLDSSIGTKVNPKTLFVQLNPEESSLIFGQKNDSGDSTTFTTYNIAGVLSTIDSLKKKESELKGQEHDNLKVVMDDSVVELAQDGKAVVQVKPKSLTLLGDAFPQASVLTRSNEMICGTAKGELVVWDVEDSQIKRKFSKCKKHADYSKPCLKSRFKGKTHPGCVHRAAVLCLHMSKDGRYMAASSADFTVSVWCLKTESLLLFLHGHDDEVKSVVISDDKKYIVTGSKDRTIRLWDMKSGKQLCLFNSQSDIYEVCLSRDNKTITARGDKGVSDRLFMLTYMDTRSDNIEN